MAANKKKTLNRTNSNKIEMKRGVCPRLKGRAFDKAVREAQKDPEFMREIRAFIKATTTVHKL